MNDEIAAKLLVLFYFKREGIQKFEVKEEENAFKCKFKKLIN